MTIDLTPRLRAAALYIEEHGWTQGTMKADDGSVCLTGAVHHCAPRTGDEHLINEVLRLRNRAEGWNDDRTRSAEEVLDYLRTAEVSDEDLALTFGPQWEHVVALVRRVATLTWQEVKALAVAYARGSIAEAWFNDGVPLYCDAIDRTWEATRSALRSAVGNFGESGGNAIRFAGFALTVRHLIGGQEGFTQKHYDTLTHPWASVIGPIHPQDTKEVSA